MYSEASVFSIGQIHELGVLSQILLPFLVSFAVLPNKHAPEEKDEY